VLCNGSGCLPVPEAVRIHFLLWLPASLSSRVRVKICGITRLEDALAAIAAGADALGFVFYPPSPRYISPDAAAAIIRELPPLVTTVGLLVNPLAEDVQALLQTVPLALLQFHGEESNAFCAQFKQPWIKALAIKPESDVAALIAAHHGASGILLDAWHPDLKGGTGHSFDWKNFPQNSCQALILAGGLNPGNIAEAVRMTRPYAVDVSGGVELSKGIKSAELINTFIAAVNAGAVVV
jgi:phosphoribosylanthranilate isomerase